MKIGRMNVNSLFYILLFMLVSTMIFCPAPASGDGQLKYSNEATKAYNAQQDVQWKIIKESAGGSKYVHNEADSNTNTDSNPGFTFFDNRSGIMSFDLTSFLNDTYLSCKGNFKCTANFSTGWKDDTSFQLSTTNNTNNTWSSIKGEQIGVKPGEDYQLVGHMKLNKWATQSHIVLEGFNESSKRWYQIIQCPAGINGPIDWKEFSCTTRLPENTTKIRPVLNAGWSMEPKKEAITWFDPRYTINLSRPIIFDPNLKAELVYHGLEMPTSMAFLGPNDILVLEKNKGTVQRIVSGKIEEQPLLDANVSNLVERGMLGIAIENENTLNKNDDINVPTSRYIFLYYSESFDETDSSGKNEKRHDCTTCNPIGHRLYRYELKDDKLVNPKLLLDIPASTGTSGASHIGGAMVIGPDNYIYLTTGDGESCQNNSCKDKNHLKAINAQTSNILGGQSPVGRGGILRVGQDGLEDDKGVLGNEQPLNMYYAYGIRNSFGIDFDPATGKMWDTENGPGFGDEINLVEPGFNSGWIRIQGTWPINNYELLDSTPKVKGYSGTTEIDKEPENLVTFDGKGHYRSPKFTWNSTVGVTSIDFFNSDKLGKKYKNDIFVGDAGGNLYHFELKADRIELDLKGPLSDKVANTFQELNDVIIGKKFPIIVDIETSPDGYLYILSYDGSIFKITNNS
jgi:aldose sugar dehydrogenase